MLPREPMGKIMVANACGTCADGTSLDFAITFAFQPVVDLRKRRIASYEALVRGQAGEGAKSILDRVDEGNLYKFDQACRTKAIELASRLDLRTQLNINFLPNAVYEPAACIRQTIAASRRYDFPIDRLTFEVSESEHLTDVAHLTRIFREYKRLGFKTAIDDFGAGYSGLTLLAEFQPDYLKLDMKLVRDVHEAPARQAIVRGIVVVCRDLGIEIVAEGIEKEAEAAWLHAAGIDLFQGYFFARPGFEALPNVSFSDL